MFSYGYALVSVSESQHFPSHQADVEEVSTTRRVSLELEIQALLLPLRPHPPLRTLSSPSQLAFFCCGHIFGRLLEPVPREGK